MTSGKRRPALGVDRYSAVYLWIGFVVLFGVWKPHLFLTRATLHSVASAQAIGAMVAIAALLPLSAGAFDLSIGATVNLSAIIVAELQTTGHWNMWPAIGVAIAVAALVGVVNGFVVVKLKVGAFIATLGMASILAAAQTIVSHQTQPLPPPSQAWNDLTQLKVGGFQVIVVYLIILAAFVWWALDHTPAGRHVYAVGGNREAARLSGVKVDRWTWLSLIASSTICGIAGVLYCSLSGPSLTFGASLLLPAYAAVFLGSTQLHPGRFNVWGTVLAVYVLATGVQGLQFVTGVQWLGDMFNGIALVAAVSFAALSPRRKARAQGSEDARPDDAKDDAALVSVS